jgi:hypothetical protein
MLAHVFGKNHQHLKHFHCALPNLYYSIQINNENTLNFTSVYSNLNEFKDGSRITKMGWATKLLLAENRTPFIPSSKRTMIWAILDVCAIRFQLSVLFHCFIDSTLKLGESPFLGDVNLFPKRNISNLHS